MDGDTHKGQLLTGKFFEKLRGIFPHCSFDVSHTWMSTCSHSPSFFVGGFSNAITSVNLDHSSAKRELPNGFRIGNERLLKQISLRERKAILYIV